MPSPWSPLAQGLRLLVALAWVAVLAAAFVVGERQSTLGELREAVATGDVHEVAMTEGIGPEGRGFAVVTVHWREGLANRTTDVVEARPRRKAPQQRGEHVTGVVTGELATRLRAIDPDLEVHRADRPSTEATVLGYRLPGWAALLPLVAGLGTLLLLIGSPEPWRATRWAWFWLMFLATPVGVTAYLLLAGPTPGVPEPRPGARRLHGGRAVAWGLVALVGTSVLASAVGGAL
ncbi:hypothetical protein [Nocardioides sp. Arc9.136]|uniref:hypothetical protein n=1 Tax=Nocardioides sp. Arc9.136 TaxID=2996826 RepID=UPI00266640AE|nr:hypothetical protein [Nocardioides sp. Arc9.136]WKN50721.1 hypothetical protein OSR43_20215 [Nocardioides sp. Arc9.136]